MFSNDTLLYLERMSAAQIIAILRPRGPFRIKEPVKTGDRCSARVNTSPKALKARINEHWANMSVKSLVGGMNPRLVLLLTNTVFVLADVFF